MLFHQTFTIKRVMMIAQAMIEPVIIVYGYSSYSEPIPLKISLVH